MLITALFDFLGALTNSRPMVTSGPLENVYGRWDGKTVLEHPLNQHTDCLCTIRLLNTQSSRIEYHSPTLCVSLLHWGRPATSNLLHTVLLRFCLNSLQYILLISESVQCRSKAPTFRFVLLCLSLRSTLVGACCLSEKRKSQDLSVCYWCCSNLAHYR